RALAQAGSPSDSVPGYGRFRKRHGSQNNSAPAIRLRAGLRRIPAAGGSVAPAHLLRWFLLLSPVTIGVPARRKRLTKGIVEAVLASYFVDLPLQLRLVGGRNVRVPVREGEREPDLLGMRIGVDGGCWSNRRGYGRFLRELLEALLQEGSGHEYTIFLDRGSYGSFSL